MPSPFPGMDPYLEAPDQWVSFHGRFITVLDEMLRPLVRPFYQVRQQEAVTPPTIIRARFPDAIRQRYLEIIDSTSRVVVAVIEVLSPTNKPGTGAEEFDRKRQDAMASPVHWLEIDLLRAGERFQYVAGWSDYAVVLKRGLPPDHQPVGGDDELEVWYFGVRDPLPVVAVPLRPPHADVALDLGAVLATAYERHYEGDIDYDAPSPLPPLNPADLAWSEEHVRRWRERGVIG